MISVSQHSQSVLQLMKGKIIKKTSFRVGVQMLEMSEPILAQTWRSHAGHGIRERETIWDLGVTSYITQDCLGLINSPLYQFSSRPASLSQYLVTDLVSILSGIIRWLVAMLLSTLVIIGLYQRHWK